MTRSERDSQADEARLLQFLRDHVGETFSATQLKEQTSVPKHSTRKLLTGLDGIEVTDNPLRFTAKPG